ncbi:MAG: hypothetical protein KGJ80_09030 [Chloroflexota bacterium]|nr:hypothetical protein [Chloroflexota bacterium]
MNDQEMFNRNLELETAFNQYILEHPEILDRLPSDFHLVIFPEDDPELANRNQALLESQNFGKPVVVVRMKSPKPAKMRAFRPKIQVLTAA